MNRFTKKLGVIMHCHNCGTQVQSGGASCLVCGTDLTVPRPAEAGATNSLSTYAPAPPIQASSIHGAVKYAPWIRRVLASSIDGVIVAVPTVLFAWYIVIARGTVHLATSTAYGTRMTCSFSNDTLACTNGTYVHARFGELIVGVALLNLAWGAYVVLAIAGEHQGTVGMRTLKIKIAVASDPSCAVSRERSLGRYAAYLLMSSVGTFSRIVGAFPTFLGLVGLADALWPLWDRRNQTLHDKVAGSVALDART